VSCGAPRPRTEASQGPERSTRAALWVFVAVVVGALPLLLVLGRDRWFLFDEWAFLADRDGASLDDLLRPHASTHWSTLPILWYRAMWNVVGLRTYLPYQLLLVVLHLTAAVLLRVVMRRAGVSPWIATAAAVLFALFGAGSANMVWAFQINEVGSLVFGLTHLLLADHDGPVDRRDWLGLLAGFAGLLCSGFAVPMVGVVGLAMLVRRGRRIALLHTAPLAGIYLLWLTTSAWSDYRSHGVASPGVLARFVTTGVSNAFDSVGQLPGVGILVAFLLAVGLVLAWRQLGRSEFIRNAAVPGALLIGAFVFIFLSALQRADVNGSGHARQSYYAHLFVAMALPAIALAANAVARQWRVLTLPILALFVIGIPGNIQDLVDATRGYSAAYHRAYRKLILSTPRVPIAGELPRTVRPDPVLAPWVTLGWLRDGASDDRLPDPGPLAPTAEADATLRLALRQPGSGAGDCRPLDGPTRLDLQQGQSIRIEGGMSLVYLDGEVSSRPMRFPPASGPRFVDVLAGPLDVRLTPAQPDRAPRLCA
jgi:uncharacterized membrane protein